jgi:hypothetical protein
MSRITTAGGSQMRSICLQDGNAQTVLTARRARKGLLMIYQPPTAIDRWGH